MRLGSTGPERSHYPTDHPGQPNIRQQFCWPGGDPTAQDDFTNFADVTKHAVASGDEAHSSSEQLSPSTQAQWAVANSRVHVGPFRSTAPLPVGRSVRLPL